MTEAIQKFIRYIHKAKRSSENTELSYKRDLNKLAAYLADEKHIQSWDAVNETALNAYILYLEKNKYKASSISRSVASMHAFFHYLLKKNIIAEDPSENLHPPKAEKKLPDILDLKDIDALLAQPKTDNPKGLRDKAMLELLYATGIRVSELIDLTIDDVNTKVGYIICHDRTKERAVPFGKAASKALSEYMSRGRKEFPNAGETEYLFLNYNGGHMSRQGFWKLLKSYAEAAGIAADITPHSLRHSFAAHMLQNGADVKSVQEMMGHADISSTQMYLNLGIGKMKDVYAKAHPRG